MNRVLRVCSGLIILVAFAIVILALPNLRSWSRAHSASSQDQFQETLRRQQQRASGMTRSRTAASRFDRLATRVVERGVVPVIVTLRVAYEASAEVKGALESRAQGYEIGRVRENLVDNIYGYDPSSIKRYDRLPLMAIEVNASGLESLRQSNDVLDIQEDKVNRKSLAESVPFIGATAAWASGYTGAGQTVAILDTGVDKSHPMILGKVIAESCYSTNSSTASAVSLCPGRATSSTANDSALPCPTGCEHGTHVAGIVAGNSVTYSGQTFSGVAKDARIIAIQVFTEVNSEDECGDEGTPCYVAFDSDIISGLQRVLELRSTYSIASANMSLGGGRYFANCDDSDAATKQVVDLLRAANIATIVASGNDGFKDSMSSPGCISTAISVGATRDTSNRVSNFSNSTSFLSLLAPGAGITSAVPGGSYERWSGTSMATPHVSAAWAIVRQKSPTASVTTVLNALATSGVAVADTNAITKPRIQVDAALRLVSSPPPVTRPILTATAISSTEINLSWTFPAGNVTEYRIYRRTGTATTPTLIATIGKGVISYLDTRLMAGTVYGYSVAAYDATGQVTQSVDASATTLLIKVVPPSTLAATAVSTTQINLSWIDTNINETGHRLMRRVGLATNWTILAALGPNVTSYQDSGLDSGLAYTYAIAAYDAVGEALNPVSATVTLPSMPFTSLTNGQSLRSTVTRLQNRYYKIYIPVKTSTLTVQTTGTGDIDLYLQSGKQPSMKVNSCKSDGEDTTEKCVISNPASGDWYVLVYGYANSSNFTLTATYQSGSAAAAVASNSVVVPVADSARRKR